jgi:hypothetical protein
LLATNGTNAAFGSKILYFIVFIPVEGGAGVLYSAKLLFPFKAKTFFILVAY